MVAVDFPSVEYPVVDFPAVGARRPRPSRRLHVVDAPADHAPTSVRRDSGWPDVLGGERLATVTRLHPPNSSAVASPVRLTQRGMVAVGLVTAALAGALVWWGWLSAPTSTAPPAGASASVAVRAGDTLWSIAQRVAPGVDPRKEVATLMRLNRLGGPELAPGQVLRLR